MRILFSLIFLLLLSNHTHAQLQLSIDHVPVVVQNLDSAKVSFEEEGFFIKPGYAHSNGLSNAHIEFSDGSEIELMSVNNPTDSIAQNYTRFLEDGEGGSYLALTTFSLGLLKQALQVQSIPYDTLDVPGFEYITFPGEGLDHLFFVSYDLPNINNETTTNHRINTTGIRSVTMEGTHRTVDFFRTLGFEVTIRSASEYRISLNESETISILIQDISSRDRLRVTQVGLTENPDKKLFLHGLLINY